jgi:uncharacterized protein
MRGPAREQPSAACPVSQLQSRIESDLTASRKAQDKPRTLLLGTILADLRNRRIELRQDLTDDDVIEILRRGIKRRRESVEMYEKGNREDLAARERGEVQELEKYLPAQVSDDELRAAVREAVSGGAANIGAVMGRVMPRFRGRADGSRINAIAREELARGS